MFWITQDPKFLQVQVKTQQISDIYYEDDDDDDDDGDYGHDDDDFFAGGDCSQLFPGGPQHRRQVQAVRSKVDEGANVIIIHIIIIIIQ